MKESRELAEQLVGTAREESERLRSEARREVDEMEVRKQEIKGEMSRVQGVLEALAAASGVKPPAARPAAARRPPGSDRGLTRGQRTGPGKPRTTRG